ncbi:hypothetical protein ACWEWG_32245 [Streptomyces sp. NPDC003758]
MPQPSFQQGSSSVTSQRINVDLPEEPPEVTEPVAAVLLHLLRVLVADPSRPHPEAGDN